MQVAVSHFGFDIIADTQAGAIEKMDELGMVILNHLGGAPWIAVDDDVVKKPGENLIKDDQGFCYHGKRTYHFGGPLLADIGKAFSDGFTMQHGAE